MRAYKADLTGLLEDRGQFPLEEFENEAAAYLNEIRSDVSPKTTRRKLGTFRGFGRRIGIEECLSEYRAPTPARSIAHPISGGVEAMRKMYDMALRENAELAALVALCGFQGLRVSEARAVKADDIDFEEMTLTVRGKGDKTRVIPLFEKAFEKLVPAFVAAVKRDNKLLINYSDRGARAAIKRIADKAGIPTDVSSHDLRSTFGTVAYRDSKSLRDVQELLGHASSSTTEGYTHIDMDGMRKSGDIL